MDEIISVLLADDHPIFRQGLAKILSAQHFVKIIGECANGNEAVFFPG